MPDNFTALTTSSSIIVAPMNINEFAFNLQIILVMNNIHTLAFRRVLLSAGPIGFFSGLSKSPSCRKLSCGFLISALSPFFGASSFGLDANSPSGFKLSCGFLTTGLSAGLNSSECLIGVRRSAGPIGFFSGLSKSPSCRKLSCGFLISALSPFFGASSFGLDTNSPSGFKLSCGFLTTGLSAGLNSSGLGLSNSPSGFKLSECLIGVRRSEGPIGFFSGLSKSPSCRKLSCGFLISALSPFFGASSFGLDTNSPSGFKLSCGFFTTGLSAGLNSSGFGLSNSPSGFKLSECLIGSFRVLRNRTFGTFRRVIIFWTTLERAFWSQVIFRASNISTFSFGWSVIIFGPHYEMTFWTKIIVVFDRTFRCLRGKVIFRTSLERSFWFQVILRSFNISSLSFGWLIIIFRAAFEWSFRTAFDISPFTSGRLIVIFRSSFKWSFRTQIILWPFHFITFAAFRAFNISPFTSGRLIVIFRSSFEWSFRTSTFIICLIKRSKLFLSGGSTVSDICFAVKSIGIFRISWSPLRFTLDNMSLEIFLDMRVCEQNHRASIEKKPLLSKSPSNFKLSCGFVIGARSPYFGASSRGLPTNSPSGLRLSCGFFTGALSPLVGASCFGLLTNSPSGLRWSCGFLTGALSPLVAT
ncbi:Uncharacterized protein DBV15_11035 [Temnothorax longispinosus]|uniref:Uncharacterized protein n=1 Tax=Temnothorax longispinosus TaxID=300112 RepID=A0A4S2KR68_9HYME|nr:Uncharacterized protein DBV15_11035 [Temnothorax longispinosus]